METKYGFYKGFKYEMKSHKLLGFAVEMDGERMTGWFSSPIKAGDAFRASVDDILAEAVGECK